MPITQKFNLPNLDSNMTATIVEARNMVRPLSIQEMTNFFTYLVTAGYNIRNAERDLEMSLLYLPAADTGRQADYSFCHGKAYDAWHLSFYMWIRPFTIWPLPDVPA